MPFDSKFVSHCVLPVLLAALLLCTSAFSKADDQLATEYRIKAAFLYNFTRFVNWPEQEKQDSDSFMVCILGPDPFGEHLAPLESKSVNGRALSIRRIQGTTSLDNCQLVYISESLTSEMETILSSIRQAPVLTVSDADNFTGQGGIIQFLLIDNKIRFDINIEAASDAGLNISSKLLSLANAVTKGE